MSLRRLFLMLWLLAAGAPLGAADPPPVHDLYVAESALPGTAVGWLPADDLSIDSFVRIEQDTPFRLDPWSGLLLLREDARLDHERLAEYRLTLERAVLRRTDDVRERFLRQLRDSGAPDPSLSRLTREWEEFAIRIVIDDVNEPPQIVPGQLFKIRADAAPGTPLGGLIVADPDRGDDLRYEVTPNLAGIVIDSRSGTFSRPEPGEPGEITRIPVTVTVTDAGGLTHTGVVTFVLPEPPAVARTQPTEATPTSTEDPPAETTPDGSAGEDPERTSDPARTTTDRSPERTDPLPLAGDGSADPRTPTNSAPGTDPAPGGDSDTEPVAVSSEPASDESPADERSGETSTTGGETPVAAAPGDGPDRATSDASDPPADHTPPAVAQTPAAGPGTVDEPDPFGLTTWTLFIAALIAAIVLTYFAEKSSCSPAHADDLDEEDYEEEVAARLSQDLLSDQQAEAPDTTEESGADDPREEETDEYVYFTESDETPSGAEANETVTDAPAGDQPRTASTALDTLDEVMAGVLESLQEPARPVSNPTSAEPEPPEETQAVEDDRESVDAWLQRVLHNESTSRPSGGGGGAKAMSRSNPSRATALADAPPAPAAPSAPEPTSGPAGSSASALSSTPAGSAAPAPSSAPVQMAEPAEQSEPEAIASAPAPDARRSKAGRDHEREREQMLRLRDVANQSARAHIARAKRRRMRGSWMLAGPIIGVCVGTGLVLVFNRGMGWAPAGLGMLLIAAGVALLGQYLTFYAKDRKRRAAQAAEAADSAE